MTGHHIGRGLERFGERWGPARLADPQKYAHTRVCYLAKCGCSGSNDTSVITLIRRGKRDLSRSANVTRRHWN